MYQMDLDPVIEGQYASLTLLDPETHYHDLQRNLDEPSLWTYFNTDAYLTPNSMLDYLHHLVSQTNSTYYVIYQKGYKQPLGFFCITDLQNYNNKEICSVMFSFKLQKSTVATEAVFLLLRICFELDRVEKVYWLVDNGNTPSSKAALRFGFMDNGYVQNKVYWCSVMSEDRWRHARQEYQRWLRKDNFDSDGEQLSKLRIQ